MIKELVDKNEVELPVLFNGNTDISVNRAQLQVMLELIKTAQVTGDINEQIIALQRAQKIIERLLK